MHVLNDASSSRSTAVGSASAGSPSHNDASTNSTQTIIDNHIVEISSMEQKHKEKIKDMEALMVRTLFYFEKEKERIKKRISDVIESFL
jgi:hypothetical protein